VQTADWPGSGNLRRLMYLAVWLMLCGCAASTVKVCDGSADCNADEKALSERLNRHALFIDRRGYAVGLDVWLGGSTSPDAWYGAHRSLDEEDRRIEAIIAGARRLTATCNNSGDGTPEIVIYIHGGLHTNQTNFRESERLLSSEAGFLTDCRYPILVNWRSGALSTYKDHAIRLRQGKDGGAPALLTSPIYVANDIGQTVAATPKAWLTQASHSLRSTIFRDYSRYDDLKVCTSTASDLCKPEFDALCNQQGRRLKRWLRGSIWLASIPVRIVSTPVVYTAGKPAWDVMLHRTNTLLYKACELNGDCDGKLVTRAPSGDNLGHGALARLLREIVRLTDSMDFVKLTLVGHSMGTIPINRIVNSMQGLQVDNIIFLAAADSIRDTQSGVLHYLVHNPKTRFYSWMLHPDNEARELDAAGFLPSGSLLKWIDNMYTTPESPLDYRFGRFDTVGLTHTFFADDIRDRVHLYVFPKTGSTAPLKHGDFNDCEFWRQGRRD